MSARGLTQKTQTEQEIKLERAMVTRHYIMTWDLDRCVGCQIGPLVCPKEAITHVDGEIVDGRLVKRPSVDVDPEKCVLCGMCEGMGPKNAITMTMNGERCLFSIARMRFSMPCMLLPVPFAVPFISVLDF